MRIANPLYDHAFKYLMSNNKLAKKVLSTILDQEVVELELSQQEVVVASEVQQFTLFRLDFKAVIVNEAGKKESVMIELQKSKLPTNLLRFRNYLGYSYTQSTKEVTGDSPEEEILLPIISVYILGYNLPDLEVMAATVDRKIIDSSTKEELNIASDFIELLTHKCHILQARRLPPSRRSRIEKFMTLFNQAWISEKKFILDLEEVPPEFKDIAEYLQRPLTNNNTRKQLEAEAEAETMFAVQEAILKKAKQDLLEAQEQKEEAEKQKEEAEKQKEEAEKQKEEAKEETKAVAKKLARFMKANGESKKRIQSETGLSIEEIDKLD